MRAERRVVFGLDGIFSAGQNKNQSQRSPDDDEIPGSSPDPSEARAATKGSE